MAVTVKTFNLLYVPFGRDFLDVKTEESLEEIAENSIDPIPISDESPYCSQLKDNEIHFYAYPLE